MTSNTSARGCQWMTKSNGSSVDVQLFHVKVQSFGASQCLHSECFVDLQIRIYLTFFQSDCKKWAHTSIRSMSSRVSFVALSKFWMAETGPIPIMLGSTPTVAHPVNLANGVKPSADTASSLANTIAPAPSQMPC